MFVAWLAAAPAPRIRPLMTTKSRACLSIAIALAFLAPPSIASAQVNVAVDRPVEAREAHETLDEIPIAAYTYSAAGVGGPNVGAYGYFNFLAGSKLGGVEGGGNAVPGGGVVAYGAPIDRVTLVVDASR